VLGSSEATENSVTLYGVDTIKNGQVTEEGRIYVSRNVAGERVRYALLREGLVANVGGLDGDGAIVLNDVETLDSGKVMSNGYLFVGSEYQGDDVTVAILRPEAEEQRENQQTAHS
jgi:hypothetical protein